MIWNLSTNIETYTSKRPIYFQPIINSTWLLERMISWTFALLSNFISFIRWKITLFFLLWSTFTNFWSPMFVFRSHLQLIRYHLLYKLQFEKENIFNMQHTSIWNATKMKRKVNGDSKMRKNYDLKLTFRLPNGLIPFTMRASRLFRRIVRRCATLTFSGIFPTHFSSISRGSCLPKRVVKST